MSTCTLHHETCYQVVSEAESAFWSETTHVTLDHLVVEHEDLR